MKHIRSPLDVIWYWVPYYNGFFEYIEHTPEGILLAGGQYIGADFVCPHGCCRRATAEEVEDFYTNSHEFYQV